MIDPFGRSITYLRLSVTDRCDLRCVYCMPEHMEFLPRNDLLTLEELQRLSDCFIDLGVRKIRLTGGEPLVRRNIDTLIASLGERVRDGSLDELTLTTNGTQLAAHVDAIAKAGVKRINVSLDSLDPDVFFRMTRGGRLDQVLAGVDLAAQAGIAIKINAVAMKDVNEGEFDRLVEWCGAKRFDLCLIETMPLGEVEDRTQQYLPLTVVRERLGARWALTATDYRTGGPASYVTVAETGRRIGFITPLTHNFCEGCNRIRITCTGTLFMCLGQEDAADLRTPLRDSDGNEALRSAIVEAIARKPKGHDFIIDRDHRGPALARPMSMTGG